MSNARQWWNLLCFPLGRKDEDAVSEAGISTGYITPASGESSLPNTVSRCTSLNYVKDPYARPLRSPIFERSSTGKWDVSIIILWKMSPFLQKNPFSDSPYPNFLI